MQVYNGTGAGRFPTSAYPKPGQVPTQVQGMFTNYDALGPAAKNNNGPHQSQRHTSTQWGPNQQKDHNHGITLFDFQPKNFFSPYAPMRVIEGYHSHCLRCTSPLDVNGELVPFGKAFCQRCALQDRRLGMAFCPEIVRGTPKQRKTRPMCVCVPITTTTHGMPTPSVPTEATSPAVLPSVASAVSTPTPTTAIKRGRGRPRIYNLASAATGQRPTLGTTVGTPSTSINTNTGRTTSSPGFPITPTTATPPTHPELPVPPRPAYYIPVRRPVPVRASAPAQVSPGIPLPPPAYTIPVIPGPPTRRCRECRQFLTENKFRTETLKTCLECSERRSSQRRALRVQKRERNAGARAARRIEKANATAMTLVIPAALTPAQQAAALAQAAAAAVAAQDAADEMEDMD